MDLLDKKAPTTSICLNAKEELIFSPRTIANTCKKHHGNLASDVVKKIPDPTVIFGISSVRQYCKGINFCEKKLKFLKILKEYKTKKATGVDNLAGRFLKDSSNTLCTPIAKI